MRGGLKAANKRGAVQSTCSSWPMGHCWSRTTERTRSIESATAGDPGTRMRRGRRGRLRQPALGHDAFDMFLITAERADAYLAQQFAGSTGTPAGTLGLGGPPPVPAPVPGGTVDETPVTAAAKVVPGFTWSGEVPHQKWMNFYTKVLSRFSNSGGLRIRVSVDVTPPAVVSTSNLDETRNALREPGAAEDLQVKN
jgi:hypothetical protein